MTQAISRHPCSIIVVVLAISQIILVNAGPKKPTEHAQEICKSGKPAKPPSADYKLNLGASDAERLAKSKTQSHDHYWFIGKDNILQEAAYTEYAQCSGPADQQYVWLVTYTVPGQKFGHSGPHNEKIWTEKVAFMTAGALKLPFELVMRSRMRPYIFDKASPVPDPEDAVTRAQQE